MIAIAFVLGSCSSGSGDAEAMEGSTATDSLVDASTDGTDMTDGADTTDGATSVDGLPPDCDVEATMASLETDYFAMSCALAGSCHKGPNPSGMLILDAGTAHANMVGVESIMAPGKTLVIAGDPDNSFLVQKVEGTMAEGEGQIMPLGAPDPLDPSCRIAALRAWIAAGAPQ